MAANAATSPAIDSDALITMNVRMLLARDDVHVKDVEGAIGIKSSTFYRRFEAGGWRASEVARIALHFGVPIAALYVDPRIARHTTDGMPANLPTRSQRPLVRAA